MFTIIKIWYNKLINYFNLNKNSSSNKRIIIKKDAKKKAALKPLKKRIRTEYNKKYNKLDRVKQNKHESYLKNKEAAYQRKKLKRQAAKASRQKKQINLTNLKLVNKNKDKQERKDIL